MEKGFGDILHNFQPEYGVVGHLAKTGPQSVVPQ